MQINQLRIEGLSNIVLDRELAELCGSYGRVLGAGVLCDPRTGLGTGAGWVEMGSASEAAAASALQGLEHLGRRLSATTSQAAALVDTTAGQQSEER